MREVDGGKKLTGAGLWTPGAVLGLTATPGVGDAAPGRPWQWGTSDCRLLRLHPATPRAKASCPCADLPSLSLPTPQTLCLGPSDTALPMTVPGVLLTDIPRACAAKCTPPALLLLILSDPSAPLILASDAALYCERSITSQV